MGRRIAAQLDSHFDPAQARTRQVLALVEESGEFADAYLLDTLRDATASAMDTMAFAPNDWGADRSGAWLYGILLGWGDALDDIAADYGWSAASVERLRTFNAAIQEFMAHHRRAAPSPSLSPHRPGDAPLGVRLTRAGPDVAGDDRCHESTDFAHECAVCRPTPAGEGS
jgi:hypothetical protein